MITPPPENYQQDPFIDIAKNTPDKLEEYLQLFSPIDNKGRYLHYDKLQYKVSHTLDTHLAWAVVKSARRAQLISLFPVGDSSTLCRFMPTPTIQKAISETDRNATSAALEWMSSKIGEEKHVQYLLKDLIQDEAISSSQLEGAATTTKVAKDLLQRRRKPRTPDEKMIVGNYIMMEYAWKNRHKDCSLDLILDLHQVGVEGIDDDVYQPGTFRNSDDVRVVDGEGNTVHTPPSFTGITARLKTVVDWINTNHHDPDSSEYLHPLVKAIALHFAIGYEHPFQDGNGRVARSLFYWYLFKNDYAAFRYIAISVLLKAAPVQYGKSYLYTETDELDMTYFIDYQCQIVLRAIANYTNEYKKTLKGIEDFSEFLWKSNLYGKLSDKQRVIFQIAKSGETKSFTAVNVQNNLGSSYNTAATALNGLVELGLFQKEKQGREWVYSMLPQEEIMQHWEG